MAGNKNSGGNYRHSTFRESQRLQLGVDRQAADPKALPVAEFIKKRAAIIAKLRHRGWKYVPSLAKLYVSFMERNLRHSQGEWHGKPFKLQRWQREELVAPLFGTVDREGNRQYSRLSCWISKKNGKSFLAAACGCVVLCEAGGQQIFSAATDRDQASITHGEAIRMCENSAALREVMRINRTTRTIHFDAMQSEYRVISSTAARQEGLNPSVLLCDEMHVWRGHELWNALMYGLAARRNSLIFIISTAGIYDRESVGWQQYDYAKKVQSGEIEDERCLPVLYEAEPDDDWTSPATWRKANPSFGAIIREEEMLARCKEAQEITRLESNFRRYRLNQWIAHEERWLSGIEWQQCMAPTAPVGPCFGGLDLAHRVDLSCFSLLWKDGENYTARFWFWIPKDNAAEREKKDKVPYLTWQKQGLINFTDGDVVDHVRIREDIAALVKRYKVKEIAYDPWSATEMSQHLTEAGVEMIEFGQSCRNYNEPCKLLEQLIAARTLRHDGHAIASWCIANVAVKQNSLGLVMPTKHAATARIDAVAALLMALGRAMRYVKKSSPYSDRGVLTM